MTLPESVDFHHSIPICAHSPASKEKVSTITGGMKRNERVPSLLEVYFMGEGKVEVEV